MKPILGITMGDPIGIGPEIIVKAFQTGALSAVCRPLVVGHAAWLDQAAGQFAPSVRVRSVCQWDQCRFASDYLEVWDTENISTESWQYGIPNPFAAQVAIDAIRVAAAWAMNKQVSGMVTAPINKEVLKKVGFAHPGHTEFLAELAGVKTFGMMMVGGGLKIMLSTIHMALKQVPAVIRKGLIVEKIGLTDEILKKDFGLASGRIAVTALNPHAGEGGQFGDEEIHEIAPAVLSAQEQGINVSGPYPADTLFFKLKKGQFDAAVALYHDQALIPIKLLAFGGGVNVTAGLPFIRTSVDHGTAYDIAGKGVADPGSLIEAVHLAVQMAECRAQNAS